MRYGTTLAAAVAASLVMAGGERGLSHREREEVERERKRKEPRPEPVEPPKNLPGETNRQLAARLKAERAAESPTPTRKEKA